MCLTCVTQCFYPISHCFRHLTYTCEKTTLKCWQCIRSSMVYCLSFYVQIERQRLGSNKRCRNKLRHSREAICTKNREAQEIHRRRRWKSAFVDWFHDKVTRVETIRLVSGFVSRASLKHCWCQTYTCFVNFRRADAVSWVIAHLIYGLVYTCHEALNTAILRRTK